MNNHKKTEIEMKTIKKILEYGCAFLAIAGVMVAVCQQDGTENEILIRGIGVVCFATGAILWDKLIKGNSDDKND